MIYRVSGFDTLSFIAMAVLKRLATFVKAGKYIRIVGKPVKIAIMRCSFGSYTTPGAAATMPDIPDTVVLTAVSFNLSNRVQCQWSCPFF